MQFEQDSIAITHDRRDNVTDAHGQRYGVPGSVRLAAMILQVQFSPTA